MSVVAWDGKILAADCQATRNGLKFCSHKIREVKKGLISVIVGHCGDRDRGTLAEEWYLDGADPVKWPKCMGEELNKGEGWTRLIVITNRKCYTYENYPIAQYADQRFIAFGAGAEFAMGAMEMGATAIQAVEVAIKHSPYCGYGVDWFEAK